MLREFWRALSGTVHPADQMAFPGHHHTFNLDYPPPAFMGDPNAPVVLLYANGGYDEVRTPEEFADPATAGRHRDQLHGVVRGIPDYYGTRALGAWITSGLAVRVNAVAYRSKNLSREPENRAVAERLASLAIHRKWVRDEVLPGAREGRRFLIVHRNGMWKLDRAEAGPSVVFSSNPISPSPSVQVVERARAWLRGRGIDAP